MSFAVHPTDPQEPLAALKETVDSLWTHLAPSGKPDGLRRILFTAPDAGQGTTTVAVCAALGLARHLQVPVTLVEAGAPSGTMATLLGAEAEPGLSEVLAGQAERAASIRRGVDRNLLFVPAGRRAYSPGDLGRERSRELIGWLGQGRDFLIVDAPPILLHPEAHSLLWEVDQVVVVLEVGRSRKDRARALLKVIAGAGAPVLGCVLNRYEPELPAWIGGGHLP